MSWCIGTESEEKSETNEGGGVVKSCCIDISVKLFKENWLLGNNVRCCDNNALNKI